MGNTGLKVSAISFGNWLNTDDPKEHQKFQDILKRSLELGINFIDTAELYGNGQGEIALGKALKNLDVRRQDVVITTKLFWFDMLKVGVLNNIGLNRKHVMEGMNNSLKRLELDYVDIVYCHRFDHETPLEEVCRGFDQLIRDGKAFYWGTSQWNVWEIVDAIGICERLNLHKPVVEQPHYNMLVRGPFETQLPYVFDKGYGSTVWSPLAGGLLTGKYGEDNWPEDSRFARYKNTMIEDMANQHYFGEGEDAKQNRIKQIQQLKQLATQNECSMVQLAMAWVLCNPDVSSAIMGCSSIQQLEENVKSIAVYRKLKDNKELWEKVEEILNNRPTPLMNWKTFTPMNPRR